MMRAIRSIAQGTQIPKTLSDGRQKATPTDSGAYHSVITEPRQSTTVANISNFSASTLASSGFQILWFSRFPLH